MKKSLPPLCIDLDGTLITSDTTWHAFCLYIKNKPWNAGIVLIWLLRGRAFLKKKLAQYINLDPISFTYCPEVLSLIKTYKKKGHFIYLATATDEAFATQFASYVGGFDAVFASDGHCNLRAQKKAETLAQHCGDQNFIYIGNSWDDLKVWDKALKGYVAYPSKRLLKKLNESYPQVILITA